MIIFDDCFSPEELKHFTSIITSRSWFFLDDDEKVSVDYKNKSLGIIKHSDEFEDIDYFFINRIKKILNTKMHLFFSSELDFSEAITLVNCFKYGDVPRFHRDVQKRGFPTFVFFMNPEWKWWWGSGLVIKGKGTVEPKPGRMVVFDGFELHKGSPPTMWYRGPGRFSFVVQSGKPMTIVGEKDNNPVSFT